MKKHFLLLMLVALLPLAGWAQKAEFGTISVGNYVYGDNTIPVAHVTDNSEGTNILTVDTHYTQDTYVYTSEDLSESSKIDIDALKKKPASEDTKYWVKVTGLNAFADQVGKAYFYIEKAPLTLTCKANELDRDYGVAQKAATHSLFTAGDGELKNGDVLKDLLPSEGVTYTTDDNNVAYDAEGNVTGKTVKWTTPELTNYAVTMASFTLKIKPKNLSSVDLTITDNFDATENMTYKGAEFVPSYTIKIGSDPENLTPLMANQDYTLDKKTASDDWKTATTQNVKIVFKGNYAGTSKYYPTFTITKAPMSVEVVATPVTYKGADYAINEITTSFKYYGFKGEDVGQTSPTGLTAPTASIIDGSDVKSAGTRNVLIATGGSSTNYDFTGNYIESSLTINPAALTFKADDKTVAFGVAAPALTWSVTGLQSGDTKETVVTTEPTVTCTNNGGVGTYDINISGGAVNDNYTIAGYTKGTYTITAADGLVITVKNQSKAWKDEDPTTIAVPTAENYIVSGLKGTDKITSIVLERKNKSEDVGHYALTVKSVAFDNQANYDGYTVIDGDFEITKAPLTVTLPTKSVEAAQTIAAAQETLTKDGIVVTGNKNDETVADLYDLTLKSELSVDDDKLTDQTVTDGYILTLKDAAQATYYIANESDLKTVVTKSGKLIVGKGSSSALNFTSVNADYDAIVAHAGETQDVTLTIAPRNARVLGSNRSWQGGYWNTMVLPFEARVRDISKALGYAIVNVVNPDKTTEGNIAFKLEMDKVRANIPFVVKTDDAIADGYEIKFEGVKIVAPDSENPSVNAGCGYKVVGTYKTITINNEHSDYRFLFGDQDKMGYIKTTSDKTWDVVPFDAYLDYTNASDAARLAGLTVTFEELDGTTTAIRAIDIDNESAGSKSQNGWYNLNGVKIAEPTQKGIYIHNGKKVVIK